MILDQSYQKLAWLERSFRLILEECNVDPQLKVQVEYCVFGGKKMRSQILIWVYEQCRGGSCLGNMDLARSAFALELLHAYSLVHDDLPCMDDDDFRRGKPTVHRLIGDARAVLVGDALLTMAFEVLSSVTFTKVSGLIRELAQAGGASGMVLGQWLDLGNQERPIEDLQDFQRLHRLKTGALFGAAASMASVLIAKTDKDLLAKRREWGVALGVLFQWVDDVLDQEIPAFLPDLSALKRQCDLQANEVRCLAKELWNTAEHERILSVFLSRNF